MTGIAEKNSRMLERVTGVPLQIRLRAWDGSETGPADAPGLYLKNSRALQHILWSPNSLGLCRGFIAGDYDFEGDAIDTLHRLYSPEHIVLLNPGLKSLWAALPVIPEFMWTAGLCFPPPKIPEEIVRRGWGWGLHSIARDHESVSHHYDVGNEFYELLLGESMTYTCAYFATPETPLADAQKAKLDLVCRKLSLKPGQRLLDVGCGWSSMSIHAATYYGVTCVAVTISEEQVAYGKQWVKKLGLKGKVDVRNQDYRLVPDGPFDAIAAIGIGEHVGLSKFNAYAKHMYSLLKPGGRFLNHQISVTPKYKHMQPDPFTDAYVFPDGELAPIGTTVSLLEEEGWEVRDVQALRENYALTCRLWVKNIEANWDKMVSLTSEGRTRVWFLYLSLAVVGFEKSSIGVNQILLVRPFDEGKSGMPLTREEWLPSKSNSLVHCHP